jgi:divalent metal cation (Fe/Co/Zn/Cd) transporter
MRTQHIGPEELLVGVKVEFDGELTFQELTDAIDGVEAAMRASVPHRVIAYVEPDIFEADREAQVGRADVRAPDPPPAP